MTSHRQPARTTRTGVLSRRWRARPLLAGAPQLGQAVALSETSFPHSEHLISAIVSFRSASKTRKAARDFLPFFEIALVFMCRDHVARVIINVDHGVM